jgi:uncharacterized protein (TIRG00374 family)
VTKRQVLAWYVGLAVLAAIAVAAADLTLVALGFGWLAWLLDVAFAVALVLVTWGAFAANSPLFGRVINGASVMQRVVALTFDDGPSPDTTPKVLDALRRDGARATFFVLGKHAERHPDLIDRMVREGHEVATHGYDHAILTFASRREIARQLQRTDSIVRQLGAPPIRLFRAPHGFRNPLVVPTARRLGLRVCGWTAGVFDTALPGVDTIVERSKRALGPGAVLLLHDADGSGDGDRSQTAAAVPAILDAIRHAGLRTVTMSELSALAPARAISWRRVGIVAIGVAIIVTLGLDRLDRRQVEETWQTFRSLSVPLVIAALLANLLSVFFKAAVWKAALDTIPQRIRFRYRQIIPALFVGFLLNTVLIARIGEVGRMVVLRRRMQQEGTAVPMPTIAGTVIMEQLILGVTLAASLVAMALAIDSLPDTAVNGVVVFLCVVVALVLGVVCLEVVDRMRRGRTVEERVDLTRTWRRAVLASVGGFLGGMMRGQALLRHPITASWALLAGLLSWGAQFLGIYLTLAAFGIDEDRWAAAGVVFLVSNLVGIVPVVPGNVGVFQVAVATSLSQAFGISYATGITFGIGLQVIEIVLAAGLGFIFLSLEGLSFGEVRRGIASAEQVEEQPPPPVPVADVQRSPLVV